MSRTAFALIASSSLAALAGPAAARDEPPEVTQYTEAREDPGRE